VCVCVCVVGEGERESERVRYITGVAPPHRIYLGTKMQFPLEGGGVAFDASGFEVLRECLPLGDGAYGTVCVCLSNAFVCVRERERERERDRERVYTHTHTHTHTK
jgi:hypothetical protein